MPIFTYEFVKMRFLQPGNREPHMRFPPPRNPDNHYQQDRHAREATDENAPRSKKQKLNFSEIKCICLNVCGIKSKLVLPEFIQFNTTHDICIFIETKTDKYDILNIPDGFSYLQKIEKYLSIHLEVLLLYIEIILKIILNFCIPILIMCHG